MPFHVNKAIHFLSFYLFIIFTLLRYSNKNKNNNNLKQLQKKQLEANTKTIKFRSFFTFLLF